MLHRFIMLALLAPAALCAQAPLEYAQRRADLVQKMPEGAMVILGAREPSRDYESFVQAPSFRYLTGFMEPDAALLLVRRGAELRMAVMFVQPRVPSREAWTGERVGVQGIQNRTGMVGRPSTDLFRVLDSLGNQGLVINVVGDVASIVPLPDQVRTADEQLIDRLKARDPKVRVALVNTVVEELRGRKSATEITLIRNAVDLTMRAFLEVIPAIHQGMNEFELEALIEYTFRRNGADGPAFASSVGSGPNSTTRHYTTNDRFFGVTDLVVMDVGASYKGYAADITRTVPVSGVFSPEQKDIYQLVRAAQTAAERQATNGTAARLMTDSANATIARGLARLGLIDGPDATYDCSAGAQPRQCSQYRLYFMHGIGHGIGLEVHDPEQFYFGGRIQPGSAFTIEPGVYVRERIIEELPLTARNQQIAARIRQAVTRYKNIGVRIEDDYISTTSGVERISLVPREIEEIEALMKTPSAGVAARDEFRVEKYRAGP